MHPDTEYVFIEQCHNSGSWKISTFNKMRRFGKPAVCIMMFLLYLSFSVPAGAGVKINLDDDRWIHLGMRMQAWYQAVDTEENATIHDFMIRRPYFYVQGQVHPDITFFAHIAGDRIGQDGVDNAGYGLGTGLAIRDGWIAYSPADAFMVQAGRMYIPFTRAFGTESTFALLTLDLPYEQGGVRGAPFFPSKVGRDDGVVAWGNLAEGLVQYRFGLFEGQGAPQNPDRNLRTSGRVSLSLLDPETSWFNKGNYLGEKKVLSFGFGFDRQANLQWGERPADDYFGWTADMFLDHPAGPGTVVFEGAYIDIRNAQNLADAKNYYGQAGYLFPGIADKVEIQPYARFEKTNRAGIADTVYASGGMNIFFNKHSLKLTFDFTKVSNGSGSSQEDKSLFTIQFQAAL
ncbi:MAG: hypothetical protein JXR49_07245 [Acidobacteria bacterium]|nr:hypothetical protein [Acidobacteriota bacterium]